MTSLRHARSTFGLMTLIVAGCHPALPPDGPGVSRLAAPGVRLVTHDRPYEVDGATAAELLQSLRRYGPPGNFGLHQVVYRRRYMLAETPTGCVAQQVSVEVVSDIILPKWIQPEVVDSQLVAQWTRFVTNLRSHEESHRTIAMRVAEDLVRKLRELQARTCIGWQDAAEQAMKDAMRDYSVRQARYDRDARAESGDKLRWPPPKDPSPP